MSNKDFKNQKAFTLVELMVAIAIIAILATVVIASLTGSKDSGRDAVVRKELQEFEKLLFFQYSETGTYSHLQPNGYFSNSSDCNAAFGSSAYVTQARKICEKIVANAASWANPIYFAAGNNGSLPDKYSIAAALSNGKYYCIGVSGRSETDTSVYIVGGSLGCWGNP